MTNQAKQVSFNGVELQHDGAGIHIKTNGGKYFQRSAISKTWREISKEYYDVLLDEINYSHLYED